MFRPSISSVNPGTVFFRTFGLDCCSIRHISGRDGTYAAWDLLTASIWIAKKSELFLQIYCRLRNIAANLKITTFPKRLRKLPWNKNQLLDRNSSRKSYRYQVPVSVSIFPYFYGHFFGNRARSRGALASSFSHAGRHSNGHCNTTAVASKICSFLSVWFCHPIYFLVAPVLVLVRSCSLLFFHLLLAVVAQCPGSRTYYGGPYLIDLGDHI